MPDTKLSALPATTTPASGDLTYLDHSGASTGATLANVITKAHGLGDGLIKVATGVMAVATAGTDYAVGSTGLAGGQTVAGGTLTTQGLTVRANAADTTTGTISVTTSTASTDTTTGAVTIAGGLGVAGKINTLDLAVTNTITGSVSGNAATATTAPTTAVLVSQASGQTIGTTGARLTKLWATDITATNAITGSVTGNAGTATALASARTIGGVSFDGTANITVSTATGGFTVSGGDLALGANSLTMTGSLAATGARVTKGWFTDIESTNMPTVGGTSLSSTFSPIAGSASIVTVGTVTSGVWNAGAVTSSSTLAGASSLTLGTASTTVGSIILKNAANAFTTTVQSGVAAASRVYTLPTDFGAAGTVLTDAAGNGTLSWAAGGGFSWGATASGTTSPGLGLTLSANSVAEAHALAITVDNTQANAIIAQHIDLGTSATANVGILIDAKGANTLEYGINIDKGTTGAGSNLRLAATNNTVGDTNKTMLLRFSLGASDGTGILGKVFGIESVVTGDCYIATANSSVLYDLVTKHNRNASNNRTADFFVLQHTSGSFGGSVVSSDNYNLALFSRISNSSSSANITAAGSVVKITGSDTNTATLTATYDLLKLAPSTLSTGSSINLTVANSTVATTNGHIYAVLGNTQSVAHTGMKIDLGTSAQAHTGLLIKAYGASSTQYGISIDPSTTGTGAGINFAASGANGYRNIYIPTVNNNVSGGTLYGVKIDTVMIGGNASSVGYGINIGTVCPDGTNSNAKGYGVYIGTLENGTMSAGAATAFHVNDLGSQYGYSGAYSKFISFNGSTSKNSLTARTTDTCEILVARTELRTTGTTADNFNDFYIKDTAVQNGAGGTFTVTGAAAHFECVATQTAGTLTHSKVCLKLTQSNNSTGGHILFNSYSGTPTANNTLWYDGTNLKYINNAGVTKTVTVT